MKPTRCKYDLLQSTHNRDISSCCGQELNTSGSCPFKQYLCDSGARQEVVVRPRGNYSFVMIDSGVVAVSRYSVFRKTKPEDALDVAGIGILARSDPNILCRRPPIA